MTRIAQKERDFKVVEHYLECTGITGKINCESERPDIILDSEDGRKIGIEVIDYHQQKDGLQKFAPMQIQNEINSLIRKSRKYRMAKINLDIKYFQVSMRFKNGIAPPSRIHKEFIGAVYSAIRSARIPNDENILDVMSCDNSNELFALHLAALNAASSNIYLDWQCEDVVQAVNSCEEDLIYFLSPKINMEIKSNFDESHLVVVGYGQYNLQYLGDTQIDNVKAWAKLKGFLSSSPFDVVAIINPPESVIWRKSSSNWQIMNGC